MITQKKEYLKKLTYACVSLVSIILSTEIQAMDYFVEDTTRQIHRFMRPHNENMAEEIIDQVNDGLEDLLINIERKIIHPINRALNEVCNIL